MKIKHISVMLLAAVAGATSCSDRLDTMPDNRTLMDTPEKIAGLLTTAYPHNTFLIYNELVSDNTDYMGEQNSLGDREGDLMYFWEDDKEDGNDSPEQMWSDWNQDAAQANEALHDIDALGGPTTEALRNSRGEALLIRAYSHFMLCNEFCMAYNSKTSTTDLGVYYSKQVERFSNPKSDRGNVADVYANIAADIEEGIPLLNDNYTVPKYHFTRSAAYAFATRFYLYYEKWDKALEYANRLLGSNPGANLRDYPTLEAMPLSTSEQAVRIGEAYNSVDAECNLLIHVPVSNAGVSLGPWGYYKRYTHDNYLAETETMLSSNIWGGQNNLKWSPFTYNQGESNYSVMMKLPYEMEYTDQVKGYGYWHTMNVLFSRDEALINRAEALTMLERYDEAAADLNTWMHNFFTTDSVLTPASIQAYFNSLSYAYDDEAQMQPSIKKHLHPNFTIDAEGSVQETMLQCVLDFRRIETLHQGLRWFDIKRYNIEIPRRLIGADGTPSRNLDWLKQNDERMALQIPTSIEAANVTPNPRTAKPASGISQVNQYVRPGDRVSNN